MAWSQVTARNDFTTDARRFIWGLRALCIAALAASGYLASSALRSEPVAGCGSSTIIDCDHVLTSPWARVFGLPVSVPAVLLYGGILSALYFCQSARSVSVRRRAWEATVVGGIAAGLAAVWFLGLQAFAIGRLCIYCVVAHACALAICALILWRRPVSIRRTALLSSVSAAGVALLIGAQLLSPTPEGYQIEHHSVEKVPAPTVDEQIISPGEFLPPETGDELDVFEPGIDIFEPSGTEQELPAGGTPVNLSTPRRLHRRVQHASFAPLSVVRLLLVSAPGGGPGSETDSSERPRDGGQSSPRDGEEPPTRRLVTISGGKTRLDIRQWPLIGKPEAKFVFVEMFDYTCPHCRTTHQAITGARRRFGEELAIVALPVPLSRACNPAVRTDNPRHAHSCELSRLAVAVWRVSASQFARFHDWLFEPSRPRTAAEARQYAAALVGEAALAEELARPYAAQYIAKHVELYQRVGAGAVPKLLFPGTTVVGEVRSVENLCSMIEQHAAP